MKYVFLNVLKFWVYYGIWLFLYLFTFKNRWDPLKNHHGLFQPIRIWDIEKDKNPCMVTLYQHVYVYNVSNCKCRSHKHYRFITLVGFTGSCHLTYLVNTMWVILPYNVSLFLLIWYRSLYSYLLRVLLLLVFIFWCLLT